MEHTKEPWPVFTDIAVMMTPDPEGAPAALLSWDDYIRARACVNACAGVTTDTLESMRPVREIIAMYIRSGEIYEVTKKKYDELFDALHHIEFGAMDISIDRASISKAARTAIDNALLISRQSNA